jgi:Holliday junction resolvasome RuvABC endonuclease subunit
MIIASRLGPAQPRGIGWGVVSATDGLALGHGYARLVDDGWLEDRIRECLDATSPTRRGWQVEGLAVERVAGGRGVQTMLATADAAGITAGVASDRWPDAAFWRPTPADWKRAAKLGGNAKKSTVMEYARTLCVRGELDEPHTQDAADALVIAWASFLSSREAS